MATGLVAAIAEFKPVLRKLTDCSPDCLHALFEGGLWVLIMFRCIHIRQARMYGYKRPSDVLDLVEFGLQFLVFQAGPKRTFLVMRRACRFFPLLGPERPERVSTPRRAPSCGRVSG